MKNQMGDRKRKENFDRGDAFVFEATGSATMVNLDGQWEHDFTDDTTPPGTRMEKKTENPDRKDSR
ncbi:hypothetical protein GFC01_14090 [Desulfofundulus thermobenzoicus]|uniref:Uncharacterized protein n=1 Tax=Desulfofundulus thermobenzoicus TaxID=29376 RepID=A0A6N7IVA0_9FIRM|nr:hypothetical protein [Desulfofundulus thermobenzoicus]MQL53367.1 hypothetical protein [Desulfofundulus thermobenzoicus]HHW43682.1 hypothetical protein [Desulfotomaculum sp.]